MDYIAGSRLGDHGMVVMKEICETGRKAEEA